jgi:hypothetical protein
MSVFILWPNESVEKVAFLKIASSAGSKIGNHFLSPKVFPTPGATPKSLTKMQTKSILYYDCLALSTFSRLNAKAQREPDLSAIRWSDLLSQ